MSSSRTVTINSPASMLTETVGQVECAGLKRHKSRAMAPVPVYHDNPSHTIAAANTTTTTDTIAVDKSTHLTTAYSHPTPPHGAAPRPTASHRISPRPSQAS